MRYIRNRQSKFAATVAGVIAMAIVASWQFSLFVMFRNPQGGRYHLWLAVSAAVMVCIAGGSMFFLFYSDVKKNDLRVETLRAPTGDNLNTRSPTPAPFDAIYWDQLKEWHLEGQVDDRRPMLGGVGESSGTSSARRSVARLSHQVMYKRWSKERHD